MGKVETLPCHPACAVVGGGEGGGEGRRIRGSARRTSESTDDLTEDSTEEGWTDNVFSAISSASGASVCVGGGEIGRS